MSQAKMEQDLKLIKQPQSDRVEIEDDGSLTCPRCKDRYASYLHHGAVTVYDRNEDEVMTVKTRVKTTGVSSIVPSCQSGNPSSRRHGVTIEFQCEHCEGLLTLGISQHKGMTYMRWMKS